MNQSSVRGRSVRSSPWPVVLIIMATTLPVAADDIDLVVSFDASADEVRLDWTGGVPAYDIHRSTSAAGVVDFGDWLGQTSGNVWLDTAPAATILFYVVVGGCVPSTEVCDGVDNDCDTYVDEGCMTACADDTECAPEEHCGAGDLCLPDLVNGIACSRDAECLTEQCQDGNCCDTFCGGTCISCDLLGAEGECLFVPDDQDPDDECGAIDCAGYYWSFLGDTCYEQADVGSAQATCDGGGDCSTAAMLCPASGQGAVWLACDSFCQDPTPGTCTGTTPGACTNVDQGSETCGYGVCEVTEPRCIGGLPNDCIPNSGAATSESCNDLDDNCDNVVDNGPFEDGYEPNGSCSSYRTLPTVGSDQTRWVTNATVFGFGDDDYYRIHSSETDSTCSCCDTFCTDEDYRLHITLTVPAGAGSYIFCTGTSCASVNGSCQEVLAGQTRSWVLTLDGSCMQSDSYDHWVRIYGDNSPAYECTPYTLSYRFETGCF